MKQVKSSFLGSVFCILTFLWFYPSLAVFFAQDDFWLLLVSKANSMSQFLNFFIPLSDAVWYRPLSSQVFFFVGQFFFGFNPRPYHILVIATHVATGYCLFRFLKQLNQSREVALLATVMYSLNQVHTVSLSWLAAYSFVLGPLLLLLTLIFFMHNKYIQALVLAVLGMITNEVGLLMPLFLIPFTFDYSNNRRQIKRFILLPFILASALIVYLRKIVFPTAIITDLYQMQISPRIILTAKFYMLRLVGVPLFFANLPVSVKLLVLGLLFFWFGCFIWSVYKNNLVWKREKSAIILLLTITVVGLAMFLMLPEHLSAHYLSFSLIGVVPLFAIYIFQIKKKHTLVYYLVLLAFFLLQFIGVKSTYKTHWIFQRAQMAETLVKSGRLIHPVGSEEYFSLGADSAYLFFKGTKI